MKIAIASDHAGLELKNYLLHHMKNIEFLDFGTDSKISVDYPDYANLVSEAVASGKCNFGVLVCGSGAGMVIAANRNKKIRAVLCYNKEIARLSREHNDANIIAFGARFIEPELARECLEIFLHTQFEGGRHIKRIEKL